MADVHDQIALGARMGDHAGGVFGRGLDPLKGQVAGRPVFVLKVDDQNGAFGHEILLWFGPWCTECRPQR
ncbi:hypothetical protein [Paracoccus sp. PAMC 22219]|uniref:hypothetical protein n=1 Tax=Paracoccus sp. PAMC 22219 TaxID=1569209 RepID=UPI001E626D95|nr:hypothetical protein [Paracoccus sp. PAMC 22219]